jgi:3-hydroxyacyl-[acyl-carrier-protein] dehydratase
MILRRDGLWVLQFQRIRRVLVTMSVSGPNGKTPLPPQDEADLRERLRRCGPETVEAVLAYRQEGNPSRLPEAVLGMLQRFVEPDMRPRLAGPGADDLRVMEDLGLDSFSLLELVALVEDVLKISISTEELRGLRTVGDVKTFVDCRVRGVAPPPPPRRYTVDEIAALLPHQPPFLFLSEALIGRTGASGQYRITGNEYFLEGHFKGNPVFPAALLLEALGQLAVLYLVAPGAPELERPANPARILFTAADGVRCQRVCRPGDTLLLQVKVKRIREPIAVFSGSVRVAGERAAAVEELSLTFELAAPATATATDASAAAPGA